MATEKRRAGRIKAVKAPRPNTGPDDRPRRVRPVDRPPLIARQAEAEGRINGRWMNRSDLNMAARALTERWPMSPEIRDEILKTALALCGLDKSLDTAADADAASDEGAPRLKPRVRLAALRVIAMFDRLSIDQLKVDLRTDFSAEENQENRIDNVDPTTAAKALKVINGSSSI